ncbi:F210B protein, partial [Atractosteus spatula]|nr:F210B protein [Atractosteus spatula]
MEPCSIVRQGCYVKQLSERLSARPPGSIQAPLGETGDARRGGSQSSGPQSARCIQALPAGQDPSLAQLSAWLERGSEPVVIPTGSGLHRSVLISGGAHYSHHRLAATRLGGNEGHQKGEGKPGTPSSGRAQDCRQDSRRARWVRADRDGWGGGLWPRGAVRQGAAPTRTALQGAEHDWNAEPPQQAGYQSAQRRGAKSRHPPPEPLALPSWSSTAVSAPFRNTGEAVRAAALNSRTRLLWPRLSYSSTYTLEPNSEDSGRDLSRSADRSPSFLAIGSAGGAPAMGLLLAFVGLREGVPSPEQSQDGRLGKTQQLRKVFKEYGAVGVTFHVGISLVSLGMFYLAISSGNRYFHCVWMSNWGGTYLVRSDTNDEKPRCVRMRTVDVREVLSDVALLTAAGVILEPQVRSSRPQGSKSSRCFSGIDMAAVLFKLGFSQAVVQSKMAAGTSTFVLAYAVHKLFAPVRISVTLVSVPFIVRYFRKTGLFKPPASSP